MLEEVTVIITGDHSQSCTKPAQEDAGIDLSSVLEQYRIVDAGAPWDNGEQLMICPNLRVAQIYLRRDLELDRDRIVELLLQDSRVDQVLWRTGQVAEEVSWYHVASELGQISFRQAEAEGRDDAVVDDFGNWWSFQGDLRVVGAQCHEGRRIEFFDYPNAFERIVGGFDQRYTGDLWVTAKLGFEFSLPRTSIYDAGGSHGSLHRQDSLSPLIVAGYGITGPVPNQCRSVDVAPLCSSLLGHPMPDTDGDLSVFHDMVAERVRK
jgi:hypothetical protein